MGMLICNEQKKAKKTIEQDVQETQTQRHNVIRAAAAAVALSVVLYAAPAPFLPSDASDSASAACTKVVDG
jgi:hypothetical protein